jgi:hypothetical protein
MVACFRNVEASVTRKKQTSVTLLVE